MTHDDDELHDRELPDESDLLDADEPALIKCPACGKSISEETEWCHYCGWFLERPTTSNRVSYLLVAGAVVLIVAALVWRFV
jgi:predicted nucleic acid-binding Zn ribbon protein